MNQTGVRTIAVEAPAKLNFTFDIVGTRPDGYHDISTIFQAISLSDRLHFTILPESKFEIRLKISNDFHLEQFPLDESNLIVKAARLFLEEIGVETNFALSVAVEKNIPIGAGLAGGSGNAAATLVALNEVFPNFLTNSELMELASRLGSDIPFCLMGGAAHGSGRGEILAPLTVPTMNLVIVKPKGFSISTPWAYQTFDREIVQTAKNPSKTRSETALRNKLSASFSSHFGNDFEDLVFTHHPFLAQARETLIALGCSVSHLTGSGPTIYGLVDNNTMALDIAKRFLETKFENLDGPLEFESWAVHTIDHGAKVIKPHGS